MKARSVLATASFAALTLTSGLCLAQTTCNQDGADLITGGVDGPPSNFAASSFSGVTYDAFSVGTTACNIGDVQVLWQQGPGSALHPKISQTLFKLKNGRMEQIGIAWVKHSFAAFQENACSCPCSQQGGLHQFLRVGCSDPYTPSRNGMQSGLGPRWQINGFTGDGPASPANPGGAGYTSIERRLRARTSDLEPSSATVKYYVEVQYVTQDDSAAGNQFNNASYRQATVTGGPTEFTFGLTGGTVRESLALQAWKANHPDVAETMIQIPGEGVFLLAARATNLGGGMWHYEYALHNMNSDQSGQGFTVPLPAGATLSNIGFHDIEYHSGDRVNNTSNDTMAVDGTDWAVTQASDSIKWNCDTFAANINANALRWGTMYNFRFDADRPPGDGEITLDTFKVVGSHQAATMVPAEDCNGNNVADGNDIHNGTSQDANANGIPDECEVPPCPEDVSGDGVVNVTDLLQVIAAWGSPKGDVTGDGNTNVSDLLAVIAAWGPC